jgi:hypothetical protein
MIFYNFPNWLVWASLLWFLRIFHDSNNFLFLLLFWKWLHVCALSSPRYMTSTYEYQMFHYSLLLKEIQKLYISFSWISCIICTLGFRMSWSNGCRCREFKLLGVLFIALVVGATTTTHVGAIWWRMLCFLSKQWSWQLSMVFNGKSWKLCVHHWQTTSWSHLIPMSKLIEFDSRLELCKRVENMQL